MLAPGRSANIVLEYRSFGGFSDSRASQTCVIFRLKFFSVVLVAWMDDLAISFGSLNITARQASSAVLSDTSASTASAPPAAAKGAPAVKAKAKAKTRGIATRTRPRHYVVWAARPSCDHLLGIHYCVWWDLEDRLPGHRLPGSGVSLVRADSFEEAVDIWTERGWELPAPYHGD